VEQAEVSGTAAGCEPEAGAIGTSGEETRSIRYSAKSRRTRSEAILVFQPQIIMDASKIRRASPLRGSTSPPGTS